MHLCAEIINGAKHVCWAKKDLVIWIDEVGKCRLPFRELDQFTVAGGLASRAPAVSASLQHPQTHNILQQPSRRVHATFIREVCLERSRGKNRCVEFGPD